MSTFLPVRLYVILRRGVGGFRAAASGRRLPGGGFQAAAAGRWQAGMLAGAVSSAGFMLVLWAQLRAPIGPITARRETSVLIGAALLLHGAVGARRWGALVVCAGAMLIGFGQ